MAIDPLAHSLTVYDNFMIWLLYDLAANCLLLNLSQKICIVFIQCGNLKKKLVKGGLGKIP